MRTIFCSHNITVEPRKRDDRNNKNISSAVITLDSVLASSTSLFGSSYSVH